MKMSDLPKFVPQSNIPLSDDIRNRARQYAYVVQQINDLRQIGTKPLTIAQYKRNHKL